MNAHPARPVNTPATNETEPLNAYLAYLKLPYLRALLRNPRSGSHPARLVPYRVSSQAH